MASEGTVTLVDLAHTMKALGLLMEKLEAAKRRADFVTIHALGDENMRLRQKLASQNQELKGLVPQSEAELAVIRALKEMTARIVEADREFRFWRTDLATYKRFGMHWLETSLTNLPRLLTLPPASVLDGLFKGKPAVIVSAGPSLDKNFHLLERAASNTLILSMNRCVEVFAKAGLGAHLVLASDAEPTVPRLHMRMASPEVTPSLAVQLSVHPEIFDVDAERFFLFSDTSRHERALQALSGVALPGLLAGSVAHACFRLALRLGSDPIIFIGQDLSMKGDRVYSERDVNSDHRIVPDEAGAVGLLVEPPVLKTRPKLSAHTVCELRDVPGYDGGRVKTTKVMATFIDYFAAMIEQSAQDRTVINATEGGAHIPGTIQMPFAEALDKHGHAPLDAGAVLAQAHAAYEPPDPRVARAALGRLDGQLDGVLGRAHKLLKAADGWDGSRNATRKRETASQKLGRALEPVADFLHGALVPRQLEAAQLTVGADSDADPTKAARLVGKTTVEAIEAARPLLRRALEEI